LLRVRDVLVIVFAVRISFFSVVDVGIVVVFIG